MAKKTEEVRMCAGHVVTFIADESSVRCTSCDFIGWPRMDVQQTTGRILKIYPHVFKWVAHMHGGKKPPAE